MRIREVVRAALGPRQHAPGAPRSAPARGASGCLGGRRRELRPERVNALVRRCSAVPGGDARRRVAVRWARRPSRWPRHQGVPGWSPGARRLRRMG